MITVKTPAKINLTLEIVNKREDGFHSIKSIMQAVSLYDYLKIDVEDSSIGNIIELSGNSNEIPYNENNLVHKAGMLFLESTNIQNKKISVYIEKNIPVAAGLAGGSTNAAGMLVGLNELFDEPLNRESLHKLASKLGSDLNFCLEGGTQLATSRGEILQKLEATQLNVIIVKPKSFGISAAYAYKKYANMLNKPKSNSSDLMIKALDDNAILAYLINNDLEAAIVDDYTQINEIKQKLINAGCSNAMMSGSGPSVFGIFNGDIKVDFDDSYNIFKVKSTEKGVEVIL